MAQQSIDPAWAPAITRTAKNLGIDPVDLGTAISYENGGKFTTSQWGGAGGKYLGAIQFGPEEQKKYGVTPNQSIDDQMTSVENFLRDRGLKPGMGMMDLYSTINAGSPGRYNASDANNGGMPGTVADKVNSQMAGHRATASALLGATGAPGAPDMIAPPQQTAAATQQSAAMTQPPSTASFGSLDGGVAPAGAPASNQTAAPGGGIDYGKLLTAVGNMKVPQAQNLDPVQGVPIATVQPAGLPVAGRLAAIMGSLKG